MSTVDIRMGLRSLLLGESTISDRVGARVFPQKLPQNQQQDSIVYTRISGSSYYHNLGPSGLMRPRIQIDVYSKTQDAAFTLAQLVKERLEGFSGPVSYGSGSPQDTVRVRGIFLDSETDEWDEASQLHRIRQDYLVWFGERT